MTISIPQNQIDAAKAYEALMVPALFGEWAAKVANAVQIQPGERVVDVACGTGILAREVAKRTGPEGKVVGVDPAAGMLAVAKELDPQLEWRQGTAESLPVQDNSFDVLVSQFGLMFFERRKALNEMMRALKPGGRLAVAVWDSLENNMAYSDEALLVEELAGVKAADAIRAPFILGDSRQLSRIFTDSGATDVEIKTMKGEAKFPGVRSMVEADLRGWLPLMDINLPETLIDTILKKAAVRLKPYVASDGSASFETSAHIVTGHKG